MKKQFFDRFEKPIKGGIYMVLAMAAFAVFYSGRFSPKNAVITDSSPNVESSELLSASDGVKNPSAAPSEPNDGTSVESSRTEYAPPESGVPDPSPPNESLMESEAEDFSEETHSEASRPKGTSDVSVSEEISAASVPKEVEISAAETSSAGTPKESSEASAPEEFSSFVSSEEMSSANSLDKPVHAAPIDINTATAEELQTLTGIGEVKANAIIEYREKHGAFTDVTQIMNVKGIGEKTFLVIREHITVGNGTPPAPNISETDLVNINTANAEELQTLYGIGEVKAAAIIAYREQHGAFTDVSQIMNVKGIGEKIFGAIRDKITV